MIKKQTKRDDCNQTKAKTKM